MRSPHVVSDKTTLGSDHPLDRVTRNGGQGREKARIELRSLEEFGIALTSSARVLGQRFRYWPAKSRNSSSVGCPKAFTNSLRSR
jgi:hypothetical protein